MVWRHSNAFIYQFVFSHSFAIMNNAVLNKDFGEPSFLILFSIYCGVELQDYMAILC